MIALKHNKKYDAVLLLNLIMIQLILILNKVKEWTDKWKDSGEITKTWHNYILKDKAKPGKNSTLYKTHMKGNR